MKKILITGASGMVASELILRLLEHKDYEIYAASRKTIAYDAPVCNILNEQIEEYMKENDFDCLIHCAYPRNVDEIQWSSGLDFSVNVLFLAKKYNVKRVVHISSQSIYGWKRTSPALEGDLVYLNNPYGTGKYYTELLVNQLFSDRPHTNIRLATIIGRHTEERVPNKLIHQLINRKNIIIQGGNQLFSFLDIRDAGEALCNLVVSDKNNWCEIYNVGTEEYHTLLEIANKCLAIAKSQGNDISTIEVIPDDIVLNNQLNCSLFFKDFNWKPKYRLNETLMYIFQGYL